MKNGHVVTRADLEAELKIVNGELARHGLWQPRSRLHRAEVFWCALPQWPIFALGFFIHEDTAFSRPLGLRTGHLYIPALTWHRRDGHHSLRNILRHEYGHAVAHYYAALVQRSKAFTAAFGGRYKLGRPAGPIFTKEQYVSQYAATEPCEDFAETFMIWLRRSGKPPAKAGKPIRRKWDFISELVETISAAA